MLECDLVTFTAQGGSMAQAIPYIRFSSFKQTESNSYQRQKESIDRWLQAHPEYTRSSLVFEDLGKSGFADDDKKKYKQASGLIKIRRAIEAGLIRAGDAVLVEAFDRATRQRSLDAVALISPILKAGVSIVTLDDNVIYTQESLDGGHFFLLVAKIQAAHGYSKILSERTKESYRIRKDNAKKGQAVKRFVPVWLTTDGKIKEHVAPHIREAFSLYISGVGKTAIANRLRQSGVEELAKCSGPTVDGWLQNKTVMGYWDEIPNVYPDIVEKDVFLLAQKTRMERATKKPDKTAKHLLVGLVKCGVCGANYIVNNVNGKPYNMRCGNRHRLKENGCSNTKSIPKNVLEFIRLNTALPGLQRALQKQTLSTSEKRKLTLEHDILTISQSINKLIALALELDDLTEIQSQLASLKEKRQKLQAEIEQIEKGSAVDNERWQIAKQEVHLTTDDPVILNAMLRSAGYQITVHPSGEIVCSEGKMQWKYLGVKRKPQSNTTDWLRLQAGGGDNNFVFKINHDPDVEFGTIPTTTPETKSEKALFTGHRYKNILKGLEGDEFSEDE